MLSTNQISFEYEDGKLALDDVSIDLSKGNIIGLVGANGSGKSTLFKQLLGLLKPSDGEVMFHGQPLRYNKKDLFSLRKQVGIVFQDPDQQIFYSNVADDVAFALRNLGMKEDKIAVRLDKVLETVGAAEFRDKPVQYLSYGQKKRVAIAGALVVDTEWLLLDEPTAGLDPEGRQMMMELIRDLAAAGKKILISSHDIDLIYEICNYVYILKQGRVLLEGPETEVFSDAALVKEAGLTQPWLVKLHDRIGLPLCKTEDELFRYSAKYIEEK
ncbi:cobalt import ATP-binding protein CbiO [Paenibacillus larvae subsp. larvae]|uniref:ABC transporter ATP-binding protein n=2 Tax=Paenibacillus larvae TaxID=1464 RepID=A0A1U9YJW9_9BACL|nr:ATP-binding cassette domain-containing protein [Paenibacillus larvae]AQT86051.1 ABC transporter ATP-binding protein [Paenibacillus larvae subsp. pulvifaciens]AQZ45707.1 ABC transporter ATP-binding protein [Paenibacillus larvae subsp. pulvifaciens]ARF69369.1 ABC transporter ATP-binding protein [Paenibacillus larvae subsp. pulvifaciens]AVF25520.1 cobalt import ATP-binding protein CbiO [Paenibacillus larvae subsp. larvae]AVF30297.1 cobalt import ATP-binding protein CbiO [Paenibacillus larvae s